MQGITLAGALCVAACSSTADRRAATALDIARRLHWEACEAEQLLPPGYCAEERARLIALEPGIEDALDKRQAVLKLLDDLLPWLHWAGGFLGVPVPKPP